MCLFQGLFSRFASSNYIKFCTLTSSTVLQRPQWPIKTPPPSNIGSHADPLHSQSRAFTAFSITNPLLPSFENPLQRTPFSNKYLWWRFSEAAKQNKAQNWKELFHLQGILSVCPMLVIGYWKSFHRCQETRWLHGRLT